VYPTLAQHAELTTSLLLLKSPDWQTTVAIYPISTLAVNNNLVIVDGVPHANARRITEGAAEVVWVVVVQANDRAGERVIVQRAVEEARKLTSHAELARSPVMNEPGFWDSLGVCTYEGLGAAGQFYVDRGMKLMISSNAFSETNKGSPPFAAPFVSRVQLPHR